MSVVARLKDAEARLGAAEKMLESGDCAGALREAQRCIELAVKALLEELGVDYKKGGKIPHDVSDRIAEAYDRIKSALDRYEADRARVRLARCAVLLRALTSIRGYLEYGVEDLAGSKEIFDYYFGDLSGEIIEIARRCFWWICDLISELGGGNTR